ncbi:hypothetical protein FLBR109950_01875 [Flavobacterium branchiophilum]|uniref:Uncharacterized protein n=1 Tax=Flavobacterium branchiophilum (strain FL-15) TaxID=1034807 RepID=G2Z751_FLABF|nr:hypothetical protein [Flavobacterium branchiophilum]CCB68985.1 Hypothetical protein FBFL15_0883 [Flavobacterium branchiophilum FL-15]
MTNHFIVNNISIEKAVIKDFLISSRKVEAVKYIMEKAGIGLASAKEIVEIFQELKIDNYDNKDVFKEIFNNSDSFQTYNNGNDSINPQKPKLSFLKKSLLFLGIVIFGVFLFLKYYIGFQHVERHWRDLQSVLFDNQNTSFEAEQTQIADTTVVAQEAIESPTDLRRWESWSEVDIPKEVQEEIERYKKRDFSKLVVSEEAPTDKEAEEAIVHYYKDEVVSLLQKENAHIKIGTCYKAPLQQSNDGDLEITRVTAMVSAFNKTRGNLGNIQLPLNVIYDFVKFQSDPETWYITDFSQNIPYDKKLNKEMW